jgi:2-amino-4-hydroxy-6-hydroxymethyldihydropteridine diphosphokinase
MQPRWVPAYVALGSNLHGPASQVGQGLCRLSRLPASRLVARSGLWRSRPLGPQQQPDFVNAAAGLLTQLPAPLLLAELKSIERLMGREQPVVRWGPRLIDLDLVVYGDRVCDESGLTLPHPGAHQRNFVLGPLAEFAPDLCIPGRGRVRELLDAVGRDGLAALADGAAA